MRWIIPEPLVTRQEDRRLGERDCVSTRERGKVQSCTQALFSTGYEVAESFDIAMPALRVGQNFFSEHFLSLKFKFAL